MAVKDADVAKREAAIREQQETPLWANGKCKLVPGITNPYAAHPSRRPLRSLLRMRSNLLKRNNLMLKSEHRERLEAWAASDSPLSNSRY